MKPGAGRQAGSPDREVLAGPVERVTFHNPENGFCVLRTRARGHRDLVTVVGHAATVSPGEWITASGEWVNDRTHGQQFRARFIRTAAPSSVEGIEKYLGSGMIRGHRSGLRPKAGPRIRRKGVRCHRGGAGTVWRLIARSGDREASSSINMIVALSDSCYGRSDLTEEAEEELRGLAPGLIPEFVGNLYAWRKSRQGGERNRGPAA